MASSPSPKSNNPGQKRGFLDFIEYLGNKLPDAATLFLIGTLIVMGVSHWATHTNDGRGWVVEKAVPKQVGPPAATPIIDPATGEPTAESAHEAATGEPKIEWVKTGETFAARSLLTREGLYWLISNLVKNFINFAPLGIVLVGMLGIGVAERTGLIAAIMKIVMAFVPGWALTPVMVFVGVNSSMAIDAGYVVLPPLALALYRASGRPPLAGLAAVFAGVAAGFDANLFITGLDPLLAGLTQVGAQTIEPDYRVAATCNWWFAITSTFVITLVGWFVTAVFVERRLVSKAPDEGGPITPSAEELAAQRLTAVEKKALAWAVLAFACVFGLILACIMIPGWPLYTYYNEAGAIVERAADGSFTASTEHFDRWVTAIVPLLFMTFVVPGAAFGIASGSIRSDKALARLFNDAIASMAPIIVLAFFAAQFTESFKWSGLDKMVALSGGQWLGQAGFSKYALVFAFILLTTVFNLLIGSMSAKWAMFAPIFVPMFMMVGIAPELTQAAYRIGDSSTNIITPLNAYLVIILVFMQKYIPKSGMGTLIATMLPYAVAFLITWTVLLLLWMFMGWPLGPGTTGPLWYNPAG